MVAWKNFDQLESYKALNETECVDLVQALTAERVKNYTVPMAAGMSYNYAAKQVDDKILELLAKLSEEAELVEKFKELYNGAVINTGEQRLVLHQLTRGQLGNAVTADGVDKRAFYVEQQNKIADFANKVHNGEITNEKGEKFTTAVQIGIGGSDLGPRAMYLALENWAKVCMYEQEPTKLQLYPDAKGYVSGRRIVDETHAEAILHVPSSISRDQSDLVIRQENGAEILEVTDMGIQMIAEDAIPDLPADLTEVKLTTGAASWYNITGSASRNVTLDIPEHCAVYLYDDYGKILYSSFMKNYGNSVYLPEKCKIVIVGENGKTIGIS